MTNWRNKPFKLITDLASKQDARSKEQRIGVLVTDPVLKPVPGPNSTTPLAEGDDPATHPGSVLQWFADVRLDAGGQLLRDCIVPNQARTNIGQTGDPVIVFRDSSSGAWQVLGRADRRTPTQSVKSYTTVDLEVQFIRGLQLQDIGIVSAFYTARPDAAAVVDARRNGKNQAGLNRGILGFDANGDPVDEYQQGVDFERVSFEELDWAVDAFGSLWEITYNEDGSETRTKKAP